MIDFGERFLGREKRNAFYIPYKFWPDFKAGTNDCNLGTVTHQLRQIWTVMHVSDADISTCHQDAYPLNWVVVQSKSSQLFWEAYQHMEIISYVIGDSMSLRGGFNASNLSKDKEMKTMGQEGVVKMTPISLGKEYNISIGGSVMVLERNQTSGE